MLRHEGDPRWTQLPGSGKGGEQTPQDRTLPKRLHQALTDPDGSAETRRRLSEDYLKRLFDPLRPHLKGVKHLFVVPSGPLARVPLEALTADFAVSYVPSGSVMALLAPAVAPTFRFHELVLLLATRSGALSMRLGSRADASPWHEAD